MNSSCGVWKLNTKDNRVNPSDIQYMCMDISNTIEEYEEVKWYRNNTLKLNIRVFPLYTIVREQIKH